MTTTVLGVSHAITSLSERSTSSDILEYRRTG